MTWSVQRMKEWIGAVAWQSEQVARKVSGEGEAAEIYRQIEAALGRLIMQPMETAPRNGDEILLVTKIGIVSAYYAKAVGWYDTPEGREYDGPVWVCYDDAFRIEIEETPHGELCEAKGWFPMLSVD